MSCALATWQPEPADFQDLPSGLIAVSSSTPMFYYVFGTIMTTKQVYCSSQAPGLTCELKSFLDASRLMAKEAEDHSNNQLTTMAPNIVMTHASFPAFFFKKTNDQISGK